MLRLRSRDLASFAFGYRLFDVIQAKIFGNSGKPGSILRTSMVKGQAHA
jgi:hypothetical protein